METIETSILKIYASNTDKKGLELLYEFIVNHAKKNGIAGVTVYRGIMGYGLSNKEIESSRFWELNEKLPVVIEMIDKTEVLEAFYKTIERELLDVKNGCLVTIHPISIKLHKQGNKNT